MSGLTVLFEDYSEDSTGLDFHVNTGDPVTDSDVYDCTARYELMYDIECDEFISENYQIDDVKIAIIDDELTWYQWMALEEEKKLWNSQSKFTI